MQNPEEFIRVATQINATLDPNIHFLKLTAALKVVISLYENVFKLLFHASPDQEPIYEESTIRVDTTINMKQGWYPKLDQYHSQSGYHP